MREMIKARREQLQAKGVKGFTLMEMLIVIAIIAILVAIAIPIFTAQLDNAKYATDQANARSYYATVAVEYLSDGKVTTTTCPYETQYTGDTITYAAATDGSPTVTLNSSKGNMVWSATQNGVTP